MKAIGSVVRAPLKVLGLVKSPGKAPTALPSVSRDDGIVTREMLDEARRRRGGAADILTGEGGAEAPAATGKPTLGS